LEILIHMVKSIVAIVLLASFMEMLLPASGLRPFARFAIGLFIVIAVLNPVLKLVHKSQDIGVDAWEMKWQEDMAREVLNEGRRLNEHILQETNAVVKSKVEGQVTAMAGLVPGVGALETRVDLDKHGRIRKLLLVVNTESGETVPRHGDIRVFSGGDDGGGREDKAAIEAKLVNLIKNLYGLDEGMVQVKFEGG